MLHKLPDTLTFPLHHLQEIVDVDHRIGQLECDHLDLGQNVLLHGYVDHAIVAEAGLEALGTAVPQLQDYPCRGIVIWDQ